MPTLLVDDNSKPIPQYQNVAGTAYEALKGENNGIYITGDEAHDATDAGNPVKIGGKAASSAPPAVTAGDRVNAYFDLSGRLVVLIDTALPAGTNIIGKFGIDQTTPGTTNGVQVVAPLPAGTNNIGIVNKSAYNFLNVTADVQVKGSAGKLRKVIIGKVTVAGDLTLYDSLTETGTVIATLGLETTGNPRELEFDTTFATGLYAGFDASLVGNIAFVYE